MEEARKNNVFNAGVSDRAAEEDALGFEPYVTAIAEFLTNPDTKPPLTLSIEGEWGSGKSSFMKQLKKVIEDIPPEALKKEQKKHKSKSRNFFFRLCILWFNKIKPKPKVVWFNAWRYDKAEALWAAFALEFIRQISRPRDFRDIFPILIGNIKLFWFRFDWNNGLQKIILFVLSLSVVLTLLILVYHKAEDLHQQGTDLYNLFKQISTNKENQDFLRWLVRSLVTLISVAGFISLLLKLKSSVVGSPKNDLTKYLTSPNYNSKLPFVEKFHEDFRKIVEAYAGINKVYVFIDDLDRCEVPKSAELMQAINLMISNDPQLIFILGMDREKVAAAFALKYNTRE
ncbi:KAP family P-loop NTPase fold protein [Mastigocoleus testarum]|nr:P-loop NTPase fold protein [Mastigocoleus testarum]